MGNPVQKIAQFFSSTRYSRILGVLALLVIIAAVPLTVFVAQNQRQELRQRAADATGATNYKFWCDTNPCNNSVVLTWDNPSTQTHWNIVKLFNKTTGVRHTKWTRGNSIRFTDITPNQTYGYSVTSYFPDFTECDLSSTYLGPGGNTDGNCTGDAKIHAGTYYSTDSNHGPQTGNLDVGVPDFQSTIPALAPEQASNLKNTCNNNPCTSVTLTWDKPGKQTYWSIVKLFNEATGVRHTKWTRGNSVQFTDVTPNQPYHYTVASYFEDLTSCDISTAYLVLPSGTNNDGDCNTNPPEPTKKQQSVAYYYGSLHSAEASSDQFRTAGNIVANADPSNLQASCINNPCTSVNLTWTNTTTRQPYWNIVKLYNTSTGARHTKWTRGNSVQFTDVTPNQTYGFSVTSYFDEFTACNLATSYIGPTGAQNDGECADPTKKAAALAYYYGASRSNETGSAPFQTSGGVATNGFCSVNIDSKDESNPNYNTITLSFKGQGGNVDLQVGRKGTIVPGSTNSYEANGFFDANNNKGFTDVDTAKRQGITPGEFGGFGIFTSSFVTTNSQSTDFKIYQWDKKFRTAPNANTFTTGLDYGYWYQIDSCDGTSQLCSKNNLQVKIPKGMNAWVFCSVRFPSPDTLVCIGNPVCEYNGGPDVGDGSGKACEAWKRSCDKSGENPSHTAYNGPAGGGDTGTPPPDTGTPPPSGDGQQLAFKLSFPGIGTRAQGAGNLNNPTPKHPARSITVEVYNADGTTLIQSKTVATGLNYQSSTQTFDGTVTLNSRLPSGNYVVKVKSNGYLYRRIPTVLVITSGNNTYNMYQGTTYPILIPGDINNDNIVNLLDYNLFIECYRGGTTCNADNKTLSDLNDDSLVNSEDLLILTRSFEIRNGD